MYVAYPVSLLTDSLEPRGRLAEPVVLKRPFELPMDALYLSQFGGSIWQLAACGLVADRLLRLYAASTHISEPELPRTK